jgi:hypothetical protein
LKAPENAKEYLIERHKRVFSRVDSYRKIMERWQAYPSISAANIKPILEKDLSDLKFISRLAEKLSFDISRFTDFLEAYAKVTEDIKPVMLHYATIYLLDFFSRTWLKYGQFMSHGTRMIPQEKAQNVLDIKVKILENGIFPRAVDAFFLMYQPCLFSNDERHGVRYVHNITAGGTTPQRFKKMQYSNKPQIKFRKLLEIYKELMQYENVSITASNKILTGYLILFLISSISRYRAKDWFAIRNNRNLNNRIELLSHDFVSEWIPELVLQLSLLKPDPHYM